MISSKGKKLFLKNGHKDSQCHWFAYWICRLLERKDGKKWLLFSTSHPRPRMHLSCCASTMVPCFNSMNSFTTSKLGVGALSLLVMHWRNSSSILGLRCSYLTPHNFCSSFAESIDITMFSSSDCAAVTRIPSCSSRAKNRKHCRVAWRSLFLLQPAALSFFSKVYLGLEYFPTNKHEFNKSLVI